MKIAMAQVNPVVGDVLGNAEKIKKSAEEARMQGADLVVFPELTLTGYPPLDLLERPAFVQGNLEAKKRLVEEIKGIGVLFGYVAENSASHGPRLQNAAVLFENGRILAEIRKTLLPQYDVFDERRYFAPGQAAPPILYKGLRLGISICEDAWNDAAPTGKHLYTTDPIAEMAGDSDLLINLSASPFHVDKIHTRDRLFSGIAKKYGIPVIEVNQVGANDSLIFDGASTAYGKRGQVFARAHAFEEDLILVDVKEEKGVLRSFSMESLDQIEEALVLGIRDYIHKCGFSRVVIGLSGGIDSALVLALAAKALGPENVISLFMPGPYTAEENFSDTKNLAENFKVRLDVLPIDASFKVMAEASPVFDPAGHGITEQNLQARIRGTFLMAYANRFDAVALPTGNKAELAVGYSTLYGDMNGGLLVLGDLSKTKVWDLSRRINEKAGFPMIPERIIEKAPSAELKPGQKDQDDLPEYFLLDAIVALFVEELEDEDAIIARGYPREMVRDVLRRIRFSEHKRQQAAPVLRITSKNFGFGRRYPTACRVRF